MILRSLRGNDVKRRARTRRSRPRAGSSPCSRCSEVALAAIGAVTNLASRLVDEAIGSQILIAQRLYAEVEDDIHVEPVGEVTLAGFQPPVAAFNVVAVREAAAELAHL